MPFRGSFHDSPAPDGPLGDTQPPLRSPYSSHASGLRLEQRALNLDLTIKNYRCFPDSQPARVAIRKGFTALVGPNNSGKSSLLKFFYEFRQLWNVLSSPAGFEFREFLRGSTRPFILRGVSDQNEVSSNENARNLILEMHFSPSSDEEQQRLRFLPNGLVIEILRGRSAFRLVSFATPTHTLPPDVNYATVGPSEGPIDLMLPGGHLVAHIGPLGDAIRPLGNTMYIPSFRNAINVGGSNSYFDIQVGTPFIKAWRRFKTGTSKQQAEASYRLTKDIRHIFGFNEFEINTSDDETTLTVFVDGHPFRLDELGSGLAQLILVLANVAIGQRAYILLDEPELSLHPSLQVDFLTTVASYASEGVLFGTHSIGLARVTAPQIYALRRLREGVSDIRPLAAMPRLPEFLGELSFSGYRELGFQQALFVEGPTDVTTFQQFLRHRNLDHKMVCLPLGGSSMIIGGRETELAEIQRMSPKVRIVIDSERGVENEPLSAERQAFVETCTKLGLPCHVLKRRAVENYLTDRAIKVVKSDKYKALGPFERLADVPLSWAKAENWRIAREMTISDLDSTDLGDFLNTLDEA